MADWLGANPSTRASGSSQRCTRAAGVGAAGREAHAARSAVVTHAGLHSCGCETACAAAQCATSIGEGCPSAAASI